ncbi:MAG: TIGR03618 family F420-dependent PPOX class oxidoreductase [Acidimicrobiales bacterium]
MAIALPPAVRRLLEGPNFVHLATIDPHGIPQSMPVWVGLEGDNVLVCTGATTKKARNAAHNPHVALSVTNHENPYETASLRGTVVEIRNDDHLFDMDPISMVYTGKPFPFRAPGRVTLVIAIDTAHHGTLPFEHTPG